MVTPDCYKLKFPKWQRLPTRVCMVKIQKARCPAAWSLGKRMTFESDIFIIHGFLIIFSAMRILYVWCTFSWSSPKTEQQNKYLLSYFLKHKEASKGKFKQGLFFSPTCMFFLFPSFFFFLNNNCYLGRKIKVEKGPKQQNRDEILKLSVFCKCVMLSLGG